VGNIYLCFLKFLPLKMSYMELNDIKSFVSEFGISQKVIANKMGMNENTFRLKFSNNFPQYNFIVNAEVNEIDLLRKVVKDIYLKSGKILSNEVNESSKVLQLTN
jgi:lambda repressor-like predicted transcriptional regulator